MNWLKALFGNKQSTVVKEHYSYQVFSNGGTRSSLESTLYLIVSVNKFTHIIKPVDRVGPLVINNSYAARSKCQELALENPGTTYGYVEVGSDVLDSCTINPVLWNK
jgi:hypothetical protein